MTTPMRPIPSLGTLTVDQQRGRACVWCAKPLPLDDPTAVPLGKHPYRDIDRNGTWHPHGCAGCASGLVSGQAGP